MTHEVVLYTCRHCGLCNEAAGELRDLANDLGFPFAEHDLHTHPALRARYDTVIPVVAVDGVVIAEAPFLVEDLREMVVAGIARLGNSLVRVSAPLPTALPPTRWWCWW